MYRFITLLFLKFPFLLWNLSSIAFFLNSSKILAFSYCYLLFIFAEMLCANFTPSFPNGKLSNAILWYIFDYYISCCLFNIVRLIDGTIIDCERESIFFIGDNSYWFALFIEIIIYFFVLLNKSKFYFMFFGILFNFCFQ